MNQSTVYGMPRVTGQSLQAARQGVRSPIVGFRYNRRTNGSASLAVCNDDLS